MSNASSSGRVVVITGAGRGIAPQVALDFAGEGARVVVVDMIEERAKRTVAEIEAEWAMVEANRKLVEIFEKKIQTKLAEIWGEEEKAKV